MHLIYSPFFNPMEKRIKAIEQEQTTLKVEIESLLELLTQFDSEMKKLRAELKTVTTVLKRKLD